MFVKTSIGGFFSKPKTVLPVCIIVLCAIDSPTASLIMTFSYYNCGISYNAIELRALENLVWKEQEYFVAQCMNIDISSLGDTREEALTNLDEAINLFFENK